MLGVAAALGNVGRYRLLGGEAVSSGTAEPVDATTEAPFSVEPCVGWAVRVREHRTVVSRRLNRVVVHGASGGVPFRLRWAVEATEIEPGSATLEVWPPTSGREGDFVAAVRDGEVSERVRAYAEANGLEEGDRSRLYEEVRIEAGDPVTVLRAPDHDADRVLNAAADEVRASIRRRVRSGLVGGPIAAVSFLAAAVLSGAL